MKTILLTITTLLICSSTVLSQENLMKFKDSSTEDSLSVAYTVEGEGKYNSWVPLNESETLSLEIGINELQEVRIFLENSYSKYLEWASIAEENNVTELLRNIDGIRVGESLAFYFSNWHFAFGESSIITKIYIDEEDMFFAVTVPKRTSSSNEYIDSDTGVLMFGNKSDFNSFLAVFDENGVKERVDEFNRVQSLFD